MSESSRDPTILADSDLPQQQPVTIAHSPEDASRLCVLIVDDNVTVAGAIGRLVHAAGWHPLVFHSAADALVSLASNSFPPSAAVLDVHLPDMNGLILSQKLRATFGPTPPIIVLSGDTSTETIRSLSHVGATYFFSKPVNGKHLVEKLRTLLETQRNPTE